MESSSPRSDNGSSSPRSSSPSSSSSSSLTDEEEEDPSSASRGESALEAMSGEGEGKHGDDDSLSELGVRTR